MKANITFIQKGKLIYKKVVYIFIFIIFSNMLQWAEYQKNNEFLYVQAHFKMSITQ